MVNTTSRRAGLVILGLLSLGDVATITLTDGENPPYAIALGVALLGAVSLVLVVRAFRNPNQSLRLLIALRILSAVAALPAFFVSDVPAGAVVAAAAIVVSTAAGILLTARTRVAVLTS